MTPFAANGEPLDRLAYSRRLVAQARRHYAFARGRRPYDYFLQNGSRLYVDDSAMLGLLNTEYATAECCRLEDLLAQIRAGDRILAKLAREIEQEEEELANFFISKTSFDYAGAHEAGLRGHTAASHENYVIANEARALAEPMLAFLSTRPVYSGGGGFDDGAKRNLAFMLSPRVVFLSRRISHGAQSDRAIYTLKDEPLSNRFHRLQLLCGESLRYDLSEYLRLGATALVLRLVDAGRPFPHRIAIDPLQAIDIVARDVTCRRRIACVGKRSASAIDVQRLYLTWVEGHVGGSLLPDWAGEVCRRWRQTLDRLEEDPLLLAGWLDWPTKLALFRSFVAERGESWERLVGWTEGSDAGLRAALFELDVRFGDVSGHSLFEHLSRTGLSQEAIVDEADILQAMEVPPAGTRAQCRGEWIQRRQSPHDRLYGNWNSLILAESSCILSLDDPFETRATRWTGRAPA